MISTWKCCICLNIINNRLPKLKCNRCNEGKLCEICIQESLSEPNRLRFILSCNICNQPISRRQLYFIEQYRKMLEIRNDNHYKKIKSVMNHIFVIPFLYESVLYTILYTIFRNKNCISNKNCIVDFCIYDYFTIILFNFILIFYFACKTNLIDIILKTKMILYISNFMFLLILCLFSKNTCSDNFFNFIFKFHLFSHFCFFLSYLAYSN